MDFSFENGYLRLTRIFMVWIGQWPYDTSRMKSFRRVFACIVFLSIIQVETLKLATTAYDLDLYVEVLTPILICLLCFVKYCTCWINGETFKKLLERIRDDWCSLKVAGEVEIIQKHASNVRLFGIFYMSCLYSGIGFFVLIPFIPSVLDVIQPLNESRPRRHPFEGEYLVDNEQYFYSILIHIFVCAVVIHTIAGATDWFFSVIVFHACALFEILGYRLEHLFDDIVESFDGIQDNDEKCRVCVKIGRCVQNHRDAIQFVEIIRKSYVYSYVIQLLLTVLILTALLLRLFIRLTPLKNMGDVIVSTVHIAGLTFIVFLNVYPAQKVLDSSSEIFYHAFSGRWYMAPVKTQKLLILFMKRSMNPSRLTAANLLTASYQMFATIVQTSISYFTVLYTLKQ